MPLAPTGPAAPPPPIQVKPAPRLHAACVPAATHGRSKWWAFPQPPCLPPPLPLAPTPAQTGWSATRFEWWTLWLIAADEDGVVSKVTPPGFGGGWVGGVSLALAGARGVSGVAGRFGGPARWAFCPRLRPGAQWQQALASDSRKSARRKAVLKSKPQATQARPPAARLNPLHSKQHAPAGEGARAVRRQPLVPPRRGERAARRGAARGAEEQVRLRGGPGRGRFWRLRSAHAAGGPRPARRPANGGGAGPGKKLRRRLTLIRVAALCKAAELGFGQPFGDGIVGAPRVPRTPGPWAPSGWDPLFLKFAENVCGRGGSENSTVWLAASGSIVPIAAWPGWEFRSLQNAGPASLSHCEPPKEGLRHTGRVRASACRSLPRPIATGRLSQWRAEASRSYGASTK